MKGLWIQALMKMGPIGLGMNIWALGVMTVAVFLLVVDKLGEGGMMKYVEATTNYEPRVFPWMGEVAVFLAGGITGCPDWQQKMAILLHDSDNLVLLNPRRKEFPIDDPNAALEQITWEYDHLRKADGILFWFPRETLCPIVLYELGAWSMSHGAKPLFVGMHPDYQRRQDVEIQTGLVRPGIEIVYSLQELAAQVMKWSKGVMERAT